MKHLPHLSNFEVSGFNVRRDRCLGFGSFADVYACNFGLCGKIHCVIKIAKKGGVEDLLLESCILKKLFDEPFDCRQKFFAYAYGYNSAEKCHVMDRFFLVYRFTSTP